MIHGRDEPQKPIMNKSPEEDIIDEDPELDIETDENGHYWCFDHNLPQDECGCTIITYEHVTDFIYDATAHDL